MSENPAWLSKTLFNFPCENLKAVIGTYSNSRMDSNVYYFRNNCGNDKVAIVMIANIRHLFKIGADYSKINMAYYNLL